MADFLVDDRDEMRRIVLEKLVQASSAISRLTALKDELIALRNQIQADTTGTYDAADVTALNARLTTLNDDLKALAGCP